MLEKKKKWIGFLCVCAAWLCSSFVGAQSQRNSFEWGSPKTSYALSSSSQDRFIFSLLQETLRCKIEKTLLELGIEYQLKLEPGFLPCRFACSFSSEESSKLKELKQLLEERDPSLLEEFEVIRAVWLEWIQKQKSCSFPCNELLDPSMSHFEWVSCFERVLEDLSVEDVKALFKSLGRKELSAVPKKNSVNSSFRKDLASKFEFVPTQKGWEPAPGEGIGGIPKSEEAKLFFDLPLTDKDRVTTRKLITNMADKNVLQLLMDRKSMERKGDEVRPVHPLKFIGFILVDPNLNRCMKAVSKTSFKWNSFVEGFEKRMKEESKAGNLNRYVPGFADYMEADPADIQKLIDKGNYEGLIKYFL